MNLHLKAFTKIFILNVTHHKIGGKAKTMVVTPSRFHAVRDLQEFKRQITEKGGETNCKKKKKDPLFFEPEMMKQVMDTIGGVLYDRLRKSTIYIWGQSWNLSIVAEDKALYGNKE